MQQHTVTEPYWLNSKYSHNAPWIALKAEIIMWTLFLITVNALLFFIFFIDLMPCYFFRFKVVSRSHKYVLIYILNQIKLRAISDFIIFFPQRFFKAQFLFPFIYLCIGFVNLTKFVFQPISPRIFLKF